MVLPRYAQHSKLSLSSFIAASKHVTSLTGIVRENCGDFSYIVEDSVGDLEKIWREDIIHDDDDRDKQLKVRRCVQEHRI